MVSKIGFGGSCHWCTEAIFLSLKGVTAVKQGWIASDGQNSTFSEAVIVDLT
jgi:peptide-methionine (S)-S-oxide reductase